MLKLRFDLEEFKDYIYGQVNYNLNVDFDGRKIVGDNPEDLKDTKYGNNNVVGPEPKEAKHGTHVAGIVAQVRGNKLGGDGVTNNAQIMTLRAVPNGDEIYKVVIPSFRCCENIVFSTNNFSYVCSSINSKYFNWTRS